MIGRAPDMPGWAAGLVRRLARRHRLVDAPRDRRSRQPVEQHHQPVSSATRFARRPQSEDPIMSNPVNSTLSVFEAQFRATTDLADALLSSAQRIDRALLETAKEAMDSQLAYVRALGSVRDLRGAMALRDDFEYAGNAPWPFIGKCSTRSPRPFWPRRGFSTAMCRISRAARPAIMANRIRRAENSSAYGTRDGSSGTTSPNNGERQSSPAPNNPR